MFNVLAICVCFLSCICSVSTNGFTLSALASERHRLQSYGIVLIVQRINKDLFPVFNILDAAIR